MSTGQALGAVVGGTIGFFVGGPTGALYGAQIGLAAGGYLDPPKGPTVHGPRLGDRSVQTSTYGTILTRYYGTIGAYGNATWLENGELKETIRKKKQGGKGGGSVSTVKTYTYSATFFLSLGLGPIAGVRRIWCQDKLIYNAGSDDLETIIASNQAATGWKLYRGTDDQLPDPRYEADVGVGNAPAYRGEAYIAFYDFQLADYGNSLQGAQFKVEVVTASTQLGVRKLSQVEIEGFPAGQFLRPYQAGDSSVFTFYAYDPLAGFVTVDGEAIPNDERFISVSYLGRLTRREAPAMTPLRPQIVSSGAWTVKMGQLSGVDLWVPEYFANFPIGSGRSLVPLGFLTGRNTTGVSGSAGDLTDALPGEAGRYLQGLAISPDGARCLLLTSATPWGTARAPDRYFVLDLAGTLHDSGAVTGDVVDSFVIGTASGASNGAMCLAANYRQGWCASPAASNQLRVVYYEITDGVLNATALTNEFAPGIDNVSGCIDSGMFYVVHNTGTTWHWSTYTTFPSITIEQVPLADIIEQEIERSSLLTAADIDTSPLTDTVRGYRVSGGSIRSALEPLQGAYPFDIIQSGYQLKCVPRGQASVVTIPWQDLGASDGDTPGPLLQEPREMDTQLPARTSIKYLDAAREYAIGEQSAARDNTPAINRVDKELALVLTADEAAGVADVLQNLPWLERTPAKFSLPPTYLALEPADVVTIVAPWATYELRLTEGNYTPSGRTEWEAKPNRAALYSSSAKGGEGVPPSGTIGFGGASLAVLLDIPVVDETLQNSPGYGSALTGYTNGWPGALLFRSPDAGQTWQELQAYTGKATLGYAREALSANSGALIDQGSVLTVDLISGELEGIAQEQMLAGANFAAYGDDGRWEIIRFQNAALQGDGSYQLTQLVRGDKGTEWATGLHQAGDLFVFLDDPDNLFIDAPVESLALERTYRAVTAGQSIDSASDQAFAYRGVNLRPLSPVYPVGSRNGSGDLAASVTRRSRLSSSWWITGISAPLGETTEAYEWEVMDGATVKRTISSTSPAITYTAADQVADFGSAQSAISLRIYQLSSVVGRGLPLEVTL